MKKQITLIALVTLFALACLSGCSGPEQSIKKEISNQTSALTSMSDETAAVIAKDSGLTNLDSLGINSTEYVKSLFSGMKVNTSSVDVNENEAKATVKISCFDSEGCATLLESKSKEFLNRTDLADMTKDSRYELARNDSNESIKATGSTSKEITITFTKSGETWQAKDDIKKVAQEAVLSPSTSSLISASLNHYKWRYDDMNASQIVEDLKAQGFPIGEIDAYDEVSDPNNLLGRPNSYISKSNFIDTTIENPYNFDTRYKGAIDNDFGGSMELFNNNEDCKSRETYLTNVTNASGIGKMYSYRFENVLMRLSHDLLPSQATAYETAFKQMG